MPTFYPLPQVPRAGGKFRDGDGDDHDRERAADRRRILRGNHQGAAGAVASLRHGNGRGSPTERPQVSDQSINQSITGKRDVKLEIERNLDLFVFCLPTDIRI